MKLIFCYFVYLLQPLYGICQEVAQPDTIALPNFIYAKPHPLRFVTNVPGDLLQIAKAPFKRTYLRGLVITAVFTGITIPLDQQLLNGVHHIGGQIGLDPETKYKIPLKIGDTKILKIPQNLNTALYQLGEGGTTLLLAGGLFVYGKFTGHNREVMVASDLTETFITMGIATQVLKRISGRESPFVATKSGGRWRPLPAFKDFQNHTPTYDAFPSGHLATLMATVTTLHLSYPEKKWIKPVGYAIMCLSAFAMANTDVHWVGDYPLAIALGYVSAKVTHAKNYTVARPDMVLGF